MNIAPDTWSSEVEDLRAQVVRLEAKSETRRQQAAYWQERAEGFEAKMNELDRAYISEHGQRRRAEDEQDRLKDKLARRSETVSRLLEERNNAEARIQAIRGIAPTIPAGDDDHAWRVMTDLEAGEMFAWEDVLDILNS